VNDSIRHFVAERANSCCEYCLSQSTISHADFAVEHIIPVIKGGGDGVNNLAWACQACNNRKFTATETIDPITGEMAFLFHPRQHLWKEHFIWVDNYSQLEGITPIGRATVARIDLNRLGLVHFRRALYKSQDHPPVHPP
jgi:hypothetical protein